MGQLEKYGLYVLCLLIFLILGVTLWGSGSVEAHKRGARPATPDLKAAGTAGDASNTSRGRSDRGSDGRVPAQLPNFRELLTPGPGPQKVPPHDGDVNGPSAKPASGNESAREDGSTAKPPATETPPPAPAERPTYTIMRNDHYEGIAREQFGSRALASEIARVNPRQDPRKLIPGKKILLPTQAEVDAFLGRRLAAKSGVKIGGSYTIRRGDTLIGIAKSRLGSEQRVAEIQALNPGVDPTNLKVGAPIRLPAK